MRRAAGLILALATPALAGPSSDEAWRARLALAAADMGVAVPSVPPVSVAGSSEPVLDVESGQVSFEYPEMVDRMEQLSRTVIGRRKKKRRVDTGVIPADRVDRGEIKYVVIHASGGAGACDGSVNHLLGHSTAAHFIVCRDGRVTRMVKIENIANHVKNTEIEKASVGIETESGYLKEPTFRPGDWNPADYWRMYGSLAWLIRAIAKETGVPRDRDHVITHEQSDRGIPRAHVDPGPYFDSQTYPEFDARFPGEGVTPREYLMRLVKDDVPPQIWMISQTAADDAVQVKDAARLGLAHIRVWREDAAGKVGAKVYEWSAPTAGLPPESLVVSVPKEPGAYRIVARDLVGNTSAAHLKVPDPAAPAIAGTNAALLEPAAVLAAEASAAPFE